MALALNHSGWTPNILALSLLSPQSEITLFVEKCCVLNLLARHFLLLQCCATNVLKDRFKTLDLKKILFLIRKGPLCYLAMTAYVWVWPGFMFLAGRKYRPNNNIPDNGQRQPGTHLYPLIPSSCPEQGCDGYARGSLFVTQRQPWGWKLTVKDGAAE